VIGIVRKIRSLHVSIKFTLTIGIVVVVTVAGVIGFSIVRERQFYREEMENHALLLLDTLEVSISDSLYYLNVDFISDLMETLADDEILSSGRVFNPT
jgi:hypothetical protein